MVNEGWDFNVLMEMSPSDFMFWVEHQHRRNEALAKARKPAGKTRG